jgi:asparagine synthase (glutamine-hydrolysing)
MCRICGIIRPNHPVDELTIRVKNMCQVQLHGGPDDEGIYVQSHDHVVLGNRRLSLMDLSPQGHQPMQLENRYWITYNGEIYNYQELKQELQAIGHVFQSGSDTEVVLHAYAQWGSQSFSRLKGMFAFAIWDDAEKELILVRDASGIKPLYFTNEENGIAFASEIRALQQQVFSNELNNNWRIYQMAFGFLPEPMTLYRKVLPLPKGSFLKYRTRSRNYILQSFAHYSYFPKINNREEAKALIRSTLTDSVSRQLIADAPVGIFLSGGVDSSLITLLAAQDGRSKLKTLSIYFDDPTFSEKKYQDILIKQVGCDSQQYLLTEAHFHEHFPSILHHMDMPSCDGINTWFISRYAREMGFKAILSGVGGDEYFGGYPSFNRIDKAILLQRLPAPVINLLRSNRAKKLNRLSYLNIEGVKGLYLFLRGHYAPYEIARQLDASEKEVWQILNDVPVFQDISEMPPKEQASWLESNIYMQNQLLRDTDVMGMAQSIEIRVPFLYEDVICLATSIAPEIKYQGNQPKQLLIDAFPELPEAIWNRQKMGFSFPFADWLKRDPYVNDLMQQGNKQTQYHYRQFMHGKMHWSRIMSLVILNASIYA